MEVQALGPPRWEKEGYFKSIENTEVSKRKHSYPIPNFYFFRDHNSMPTIDYFG